MSATGLMCMGIAQELVERITGLQNTGLSTEAVSVGVTEAFVPDGL